MQPISDMQTLCPWNGLRCECRSFPWLNAQDIVPRSCEVYMPDELLGRRKVSEAGKARYRAYLAELEANRRKALANGQDGD